MSTNELTFFLLLCKFTIGNLIDSSTSLSMSATTFSILGKNLKAESKADLEPYLSELEKLEDVEEVHFGGNSLGVEACKAIAQVLKTKTKLKVRSCSQSTHDKNLRPDVDPFVKSHHSRSPILQMFLLDASSAKFRPHCQPFVTLSKITPLSSNSIFLTMLSEDDVPMPWFPFSRTTDTFRYSSSTTMV